MPERLKLESLKPDSFLYRQVTQENFKPGTAGEERRRYLLEYFTFTKSKELPTDLPLASILTTRGGSKTDEEREKKILDGRIYLPGIDFQVTDPWYHPNLKWSLDLPPNFTRLFLKHLALIITAQAASQNVREITWCISYPSAFSPGAKDGYRNDWDEIITDLNQKTGIKHSFDSAKGNNFLTESLAFAQYFTSPRQPGRFGNSVFIDIGGGTSDLSIWDDRHLIYQCSIKLAGQHLFAQFLEQHQEILNLLFKEDVLNKSLFNSNDRAKLSGQPPERVYPLLDILLKTGNPKSLQQIRQGKDSGKNQGKITTFTKLIQLSELGLAGLYYYVGLLLKVLNEKPDEQGLKYQNSQRQLPNIYLGGNGSRLLDLISSSGKFIPNSPNHDSPTDSLLRKMLELSSPNSSFTEKTGKTELSHSELRKGEVAFGFILAQKKPLPGLNPKTKYPYLAEKCASLGTRYLSGRMI